MEEILINALKEAKTIIYNLSNNIEKRTPIELQSIMDEALNKYTIASEKHPNGLTAWKETHFEIVSAISHEWRKDSPQGVVLERQEAQGHGGLYELAEELTDKFEQIHKGYEWDGEFFDTIEEFVGAEL